jgi:hypothetical protein
MSFTKDLAHRVTELEQAVNVLREQVALLTNETNVLGVVVTPEESDDSGDSVS